MVSWHPNQKPYHSYRFPLKKIEENKKRVFDKGKMGKSSSMHWVCVGKRRLSQVGVTRSSSPAIYPIPSFLSPVIHRYHPVRKAFGISKSSKYEHVFQSFVSKRHIINQNLETVGYCLYNWYSCFNKKNNL